MTFGVLTAMGLRRWRSAVPIVLAFLLVALGFSLQQVHFLDESCLHGTGPQPPFCRDPVPTPSHPLRHALVGQSLGLLAVACGRVFAATDPARDELDEG